MGMDEMIFEPLFDSSPELELDGRSKGLISASARVIGESLVEVRIKNETKMYLHLYFDGPRVEPIKRGYLALTDLLKLVEATPEMKRLVEKSFRAGGVILLPDSTADFHAYMKRGDTLQIRAELSEAAALFNGLDPLFALLPGDAVTVSAFRDLMGAESDFYQALMAYQGEWLIKTYYGLNIVKETLRTGWLFGSDVLKSIAQKVLLLPAVAELVDKSLERGEAILDKGPDALVGGRIVIGYPEKERKARNLTNHPARDWFPVWSPDGTRITFESDRDGNWEIYVMSADGARG
jgi:hypothetical protein